MDEAISHQPSLSPTSMTARKKIIAGMERTGRKSQVGDEVSTASEAPVKATRALRRVATRVPRAAWKVTQSRRILHKLKGDQPPKKSWQWVPT